MLKISIFLIFCLGVSAQFRPNCQQPLHFGVQQCSNSSSIRYHFDLETKKCLAFKYSGCGGNTNNFSSRQDCQFLCVPQDYFSCPGGSDPILNKNGKTSCGGRENLECDGPNGYCKRGHFVGKCCDSRIRDKIDADYAKECGPGKQKHHTDNGGIELPLFGKTCDSAFCPANTKCHQGNYFAYCCA
ncbi:hypothetical protein L5515_007420 [Caenorhabditis briggsae]|uniref:BPTI/Kunitz inhibitor domain-containing protein n=1 Tax=Caenorhabditis briggsae TaxID=6238 RepID=A0AAE9JJE9_CAEBR|nr:hypothetical protein L5515_007420 [Caenorhabditis briggsae]